MFSILGLAYCFSILSPLRFLVSSVENIEKSLLDFIGSIMTEGNPTNRCTASPPATGLSASDAGTSAARGECCSLGPHGSESNPAQLAGVAEHGGEAK
jgi:hypothetical protein